eukprot:scaffold1727_cov133-Cylindrotheca_fusiformis.AAC.63
MKLGIELFLGVLFLISFVANGLVVIGNHGRTPARTGRKFPSTNLYSSSVVEETGRIQSLPLPPSRKKGPFRGIRESISHLSNNQRFVRKRAEELGDVFLTNVFFQPTVVIGGKEAIQEFVSGTELKAKVINGGFPDTFKELHTKWGTLNLDANDEVFKEAREMFANVFGQESLKEYTPVLYREMELYMEDLKARVQANPEEPIKLVPELKELSLQIFSKIFSGEPLTKEQVQMFDDYNDALLALPFQKKKVNRGKYALESLKKEMLARFKKCPVEGDPSNSYFQAVKNQKGWEDEDRICSMMVLLIWGAYIECTSLMANSLVAIQKYDPSYIDIVRIEVHAAAEGKSPSEFGFWSGLGNTLGVLRESLRLIPTGGGSPRYSNEDFEFRGYRIPAGTVVIMDPRIGNTDPKLFKSPEEFKPTRWWVGKQQQDEGESSSSSSGCPFQGTALKLGFGSWFPGGFGAHQCPGIPLAELIAKIFLAKTVEAFDGWSFAAGKGNGATKAPDKVKFVEVPIKHPTDDFGVKFSLRKDA